MSREKQDNFRKFNAKELKNKLLEFSEIDYFEPFRLETDGKTYISVYGNCELTECIDTKALFGTKDLKTEIDGFDFELALYSDTQLIITGKPDKITFFG